MSFSKRSAYGTAFVAFAGAVFCALNATKNLDAICITTGCEIFKDISVFGISLWWIGTALFISLALLNLLKLPNVALLLAFCAVTIDLGFLLLMVFTAPCVPCLFFAAILLLIFFMQCSSLKHPFRLFAPLAIIWVLLATPNIFAIISEEMGSWAIHGNKQADVQVFFSPSCTACKKLIPNLTKDNAGNITFYPVAEVDDDLERIFVMQKALNDGMSMYVAFNRAVRVTPADVSLPLMTRLKFQWNLFRNKSKLASIGVTRIPVLITNGVPKSLLTTGQQQEKTGDTLDFTDDFSGCTEDDSVPCE